MKNFNLQTILLLIIAVGVGYLIGIQSQNEPITKEMQAETNEIKNEQSSERLQQKRLTDYRNECQKEYAETGIIVDNLVKSEPNITPEQAQSIGKKAGIVDDNGYVIDEYIWVKACVDKKVNIYE